MENSFSSQESNIDGYELRDGYVRRPDVKAVSILFSISVFLFAFIGSRVQQAEFYSGILITEFIIIMCPPLILLLMYKYDIRKVLRLNKIGLLNLFLIFCIMIFALPLVGIVNAANLMLIKYIFGSIDIMQPPIATDTIGLLVNVFVIGMSPAICEEVLFRGTIQRGFERFGTVKAILGASLLFGMMHFDFQKLLGTFLLGALIGFIVYRTNSLFGGMMAHFTNNSLAVVITYFSYRFMEFAKSSGIQGADASNDVDRYMSNLAAIPKVQLVGVIIGFAFIFFVCLSVFIGLMVGLVKNTSVRATSSPLMALESKKSHALWLVPGAALIGLIYFATGLKLTGGSIQWVNSVLQFIGLR